MFEDNNLVRQTVESGFGKQPVLVVGDLILDRYLWGSVDRISPEAPVPVIHLQRTNEVAGGAANVAINLAALGLSTYVAGFCGDDGERNSLLQLIQQQNIDISAVITLAGRDTITKTRVIGGHQQMLRIDKEEIDAIPEPYLEQMLQQINIHIDSGLSAIILSDYAKGALPEKVCKSIIASAKKANNIPVLVDPKGHNYSKYAGATTISPNRKELALACRHGDGDLNTLLDAGRELQLELQLEFLTVTLGEQGIAMVGEENHYKIPAKAREVYDVSGAGDTVIAILAAGIAAKLPRLDILHLANLAGGIVVEKVGTAPVSSSELLQAISSEQVMGQSGKICTLEQARIRVSGLRHNGKTIVFTNGCFDLLHAGHVKYLQSARQLGDLLILGLNSDVSVRRLKGETRPILEQEERSQILAALDCVDYVVIFDEDTPLELIKVLQPQILVKGGDYSSAQVVGRELIESYGGRVEIIPFLDGKSTSNIVENILKNYSLRLQCS